MLAGVILSEVFRINHWRRCEAEKQVWQKAELNGDIVIAGFPRWLSDKESTCYAGDEGDSGSVPGSGRSPGGEHGNPLQYSGLENPMDREAWQAMVHLVKELDTTEATRAGMHMVTAKPHPVRRDSPSELFFL